MKEIGQNLTKLNSYLIFLKLTGKVFLRIDVNESTEVFIKTIDSLLDKHVPFKKVSKYEMKLKNKPWITNAIKKSIKVKKQFLSRYIKSKNSEIKNL